jgi:hypothetical protein
VPYKSASRWTTSTRVEGFEQTQQIDAQIERNPARPEHIITESGVEYRLVGVR